ncbi:MAG TPA: PD-(D/E)XK nuclease family protein [Thermoanaerobaculia bacterium]|nr:PD-(D/E)XK nuclease family protein [Thermoanaerobaculia bacterium]
MPSLHFSRYHEIAADVAGALIARRGDDPLRGWNDEVIVASSGMAQAIAAEVVARAGGVAGLQLQTPETLARRIVNDAGEYPRVATEEERRLAMRAAVRAIDHSILETRGIASLLERALRDVRDSGLSIDQLGERVRTASGLRDRERKKLVLRVFAESERLIAATGAIDPADLLRRAAGIIRSGAPVARQIVAGFYDMTGAQLELLLALRDAGHIASVHVPAGDGESYRFAHRFVGSVAGGTPRRDPAFTVREPQWSVSVHETRPKEIAAICAAVGTLLRSGTPPRAIGIAARAIDPHDAALFRRLAASEGFTTTGAPETPLAAHRIARGILLLLRLNEKGFPRGDVLEVVRSGLRTAARINVDRADAETRQAKIAGGTSERLRLVRSPKFAVADFIAVVAELESLAPPRGALLRGAQWSEWLREAIDRFRIETAVDVDCAAALEEIADLFRLADRTNVRFDSGAVIEAIEARALQKETAPSLPAVWLGDVMTFRGRTFEHLFVFGAQEGSFPQRRIEDPLLPDADRRLLGIREIGDGRDEERFLFRLLFDGARATLRFSFARTDGFGKLLRPSQFLRNFVIERHPERREELLADFAAAVARGVGNEVRDPAPIAAPGEGEGAGTPARPSRRALQLLARSGTNGPFDGYIAGEVLRSRFAAALESLSPTALEDFGECPQKFLLKHILNVRDIDDPDHELEIQPREKGLLAHEVLENFYRGLSRDEFHAAAANLPLLPPELVARLDAEIDRAFDRLEEAAPPLNANMRRMERGTARRLLRDFIAADFADLAETGLFPTEFEYLFGSKYRERARHPEPFLIETGGVTLRVEGRIDRIDEGDEKVRIVDYKYGKALRHVDLGEKIDKGVRLQLPLYAMAVAAFRGMDPSRVDGAIKPLTVTTTKGEKFAFSLADKQEHLKETLEIFATAISQGRFPAYPNERDDDFNSCKYCPVNESCRTKHDPEEAYAVTRAGDPRTLLAPER